MRILIHAFGTRGDVQPYVALAIGLQNAGHEVKLVAPSQFEAFVGTRGIPFGHLPGDMLALMETPRGKEAISGARGFNAGLKLLGTIRPLMRKLLDAQWNVSRTFQPDLIIYHPKAIGAPHVAERLRCPAILASPIPGFTPTSAFASPLMPFNLNGTFNRLSHRVMAGSGEFLFRSLLAEWRESALDLPKRVAQKRHSSITLYAYSPHVLPVPPEWVEGVSVTGYWFLDDASGWEPQPDLSAFLAQGDPPVYVGFGSMPGVDPKRMTGIFIEALQRANRRGILATGEGALAAANHRHVFTVKEAPHDKLLPLVSACIHHGGAGSTAASLRAGKPTITCPFFGDQRFWGRRVHQLGAGPRPLDRKNLSVETLAPAIGQATTDASMRWKASSLGEAIRAEHGVGAAVALINSQLELSYRSLAG